MDMTLFFFLVLCVVMLAGIAFFGIRFVVWFFRIVGRAWRRG